MPTKLSTFNLVPGTLDTGRPTITSVISTDASYTSTLTTVSVTGGYVRILGTNFKSNEQVYIRSSDSQSYSLASTIVHISSSEIRATLPASTAGLKMLWVVNNNGTTAMSTITYK